jgi:hypothetical protein
MGSENILAYQQLGRLFVVGSLGFSAGMQVALCRHPSLPGRLLSNAGNKALSGVLSWIVISKESKQMNFPRIANGGHRNE